MLLCWGSIEFLNDKQDENRFLTIAGILIATASLMSVVFAIVVYIESSLLHARFEAVKKDIETLSDNHRSSIAKMETEAREAYYSAAHSILEAMFSSLQSMPSADEESYNEAYHCITSASIDVFLAKSTKGSLERAIQAAYKLDRIVFLRLEGEVWSKSSKLCKGDMEHVRESYSTLKEKALAAAMYTVE